MLTIKTKRPRALLNGIREAIDKGHVRTWKYGAHGNFTHATDQWAWQAWLTPTVLPEQALIFTITFNKSATVSQRELYAIYHGRFLEMLLSHFDNDFEIGEATALLSYAETT